MAKQLTASHANTKKNIFNRVTNADLFIVACSIILVISALYLSANAPQLDINITLALSAVGSVILALVALYKPALSRYTSILVALIGANAFLYHLDVYSTVCRFSREMNDVFWFSALATGGLMMQVFISRKKLTVDETYGTGAKFRLKRNSRISTGSIILYIVMLIMSLIALVPFLWMISTSFMTLGETINRTWVPADAQICNYYVAWNAGRFSIYFTNSSIIALTTIAGLLLVSILSAYAFAKINFVGRNLLFTILLATLMVPDIVVMIPNYLTVSGQIFPIPVGRDVFPFIEFGSGRGFTWIDTLPALTVPFMGSAFSIFLLRQFFMQIPNDLWDAARIDGAGHFRFLVQIVVPISQASILTVALLTFIGSWNSLLWPLLVTRDPLTWRPISYGLNAFNDESGTQTHLIAAAAFITILPMLVLYFLTQKSFTEGIATTGLKG
jgi:ABC-type glycerol-3-phosphate transport system permease component